MDSVKTKQTSARAFIRSLNILLKYARLYSFDHARTAEQFNTAWNELHEAIPVTNESGLLLSATGSQLLLDGVPIDASPAFNSHRASQRRTSNGWCALSPRIIRKPRSWPSS
jgi:hypothetical protein